MTFEQVIAATLEACRKADDEAAVNETDPHTWPVSQKKKIADNLLVGGRVRAMFLENVEPWGPAGPNADESDVRMVVTVVTLRAQADAPKMRRTVYRLHAELKKLHHVESITTSDGGTRQVLDRHVASSALTIVSFFGLCPLVEEI